MDSGNVIVNDRTLGYPLEKRYDMDDNVFLCAVASQTVTRNAAYLIKAGASGWAAMTIDDGNASDYAYMGFADATLATGSAG